MFPATAPRQAAHGASEGTRRPPLHTGCPDLPLPCPRPTHILSKRGQRRAKLGYRPSHRQGPDCWCPGVVAGKVTADRNSCSHKAPIQTVPKALACATLACMTHREAGVSWGSPRAGLVYLCCTIYSFSCSELERWLHPNQKGTWDSLWQFHGWLDGTAKPRCVVSISLGS